MALSYRDAGNPNTHRATADPITPVKRDREFNNRNAASPASSVTGGFSAIHTSVKRGKTIKFHDRFKGKIQMMNKEGHIGVVKSTSKPIEKVSIANDQLQRVNSSVSHSSNIAL